MARLAETRLRGDAGAPCRSEGDAEFLLTNGQWHGAACHAEIPRGSGLERERIWHGAACLLAALSSARTTGCVLCNDAATTRRSELAREAFGFLFRCWNAALSSARTTDCASHGALLFSVTGWPDPKKVSKKACPFIRVRSLRALTPLAPVPFQGPAAKGHPWPIAAFAASLPLNPFHDTCARPPARGVWFRLLARAQSKKRKPRSICTKPSSNSDLFPVRRPSAGVAQGDARHGRRARNDGAGTPHRDGPRSSAGAREVRPRSGRTRMPGWPSFWLLFLGQTRKSDAPCKAQPVARAEESAASEHPSRCQPHSRARTRRPPRSYKAPRCRGLSFNQGKRHGQTHNAVPAPFAVKTVPQSPASPCPRYPSPRAARPEAPLPMKSPSECA